MITRAAEKWLRRNKRGIVILFQALIALLVIKAVYSLYTDWGEVDWAKHKPRFLELVPFSALLVASYLIYIRSWQESLRTFGQSLNFRDSLVIYMKSQLAKYIPGKVGLILAKVFLAEKKGLSRKLVLVSSSLELVAQLYIMLVVASLAMLLVDFNEFGIEPFWKWLVLVVIIISLPFANPSIFLRASNFGLKLIGKSQLAAIEAKHFYRMFILKLTGTVLSGCAVFYSLRLFGDLSYNHLLFVVASSSMAFLLGLLAIFAPSGIGVRDSILAFMFSLIVLPPIALAAVITLRLLVLLHEFSLIGLAQLLETRSNGK